jgi:FkbM family methyltransferase
MALVERDVLASTSPKRWGRLGLQLRALRQYAAVMQSPLDAWRYAQLRMRYGFARMLAQMLGGESGSSHGAPGRIRVRALDGASVLCRPSQDVWPFKHTFMEQFHLPPMALPERATIVDLGSNVGYTVAHLAARYPAARVIGVEMDAANFQLAVQNTAHFGERVRLIHAAVWTTDGIVSYTGEDDDAFQVSEPSGASGARSAPARRLAGILDEYGVEEVDYLKMDIEGAEAAILADPAEWCSRVRSIKVEIHSPFTAAECRAKLEAHGFTCWTDDQHWNCVCAVRRASVQAGGQASA